MMKTMCFGEVIVYTRKAIEGDYSASLGNSIHIAYRIADNSFEPLNNNYGIVFAKASVSSDNTIIEKGVVNPYIFKTLDGSYGIVAVRVGAYGVVDEESVGKVLLFLSKDLITFEEVGLITTGKSEYVSISSCEYNGLKNIYELRWRGKAGHYYTTELSYAFEYLNVTRDADSAVQETRKLHIKGAVPGNSLCIDKKTSRELLIHWMPLRNIDMKVPESIEASSAADVNAVKASALYSDGSNEDKCVDWDLHSIDFTKPGEYRINGKIRSASFDFPLASGYADPQVFRWKGMYYFIATNDNLNDVGLFVRESETVEGLFAAGVTEYCILEYDKERQFTQCFWAPELHEIGGEIYILLALSGDAWSPQSYMMRLRPGGSIVNASDWEVPQRVLKSDGSYLADQDITLDMTYFEVLEKSYLIWSQRYGIGTPADTGSMLYIAQVNPSRPWVITSEPSLISRPLYGWENIDGTVNNEGPYALILGDDIYIAYSGGAAGGYSYVIGILHSKKGSNLLDAAEWSKTGVPVFSYYSIDGIYGPGHNTFYKDEDGNIMIVYHAQETKGRSPRCTAINRIHLRKNSCPVFDMSCDRDVDRALENVSLNVIVTGEGA